MLGMDSDLAKLVNRSGFLFQLSVEEHVRQTASKHEWEVLAREYPWSSPDGARAGFIDIVAARGTLRCVIECKRTQGGDWIFLVPHASKETSRLRTLWSFGTNGNSNRTVWGWDDLEFDPPTLVSEFCVVRGASDDDRPLLERLAGDVVRASESLAREELLMPDRYWGSGAYLPVIVTNARLRACRVDLGKVELTSGSVPPDATFEEVGAIRFRKALATDLSHSAETYRSLKEGLLKKERSALVVSVGYLAEWLQHFRRLRHLCHSRNTRGHIYCGRLWAPNFTMKLVRPGFDPPAEPAAP